MVKPKTKRKDLEAPQYVIDEWKTGNKNAIADLLKEANFCQDIFWEQFFHTIVCRYLRFNHTIHHLYIYIGLAIAGEVFQHVANHDPEETVCGTVGGRRVVLRSWVTRWPRLVPVHPSINLFSWNLKCCYMCYKKYNRIARSNPYMQACVRAKPRQKIDGAKAHCMSMGDSHCRTVFESQTTWIEFITLSCKLNINTFFPHLPGEGC